MSCNLHPPRIIRVSAFLTPQLPQQPYDPIPVIAVYATVTPFHLRKPGRRSQIPPFFFQYREVDLTAPTRLHFRQTPVILMDCFLSPAGNTLPLHRPSHAHLINGSTPAMASGNTCNLCSVAQGGDFPQDLPT